MLKEEGDTSHVCQSYDQYSSNQYKASFTENTSVLLSWVTATIGVLNYWCTVNVGLQDVKKLLR